MRLRRRGGLDAGAARASARPAGVALVYHAVGDPPGDPRCELVPSFGTSPFTAQLEHLVGRYRVVPPSRLDAVLERRAGEPFPVALTFDDDLQSHVEVVAPILRRANLPAAFFLSGASLDRPQPFWWHDLQAVIEQRGASSSRLRSLPELDLTPAIRRVPHAVHEIAEHIQRLPPERRSAVAEEPRSHAGKPRRALSARAIDRLSAVGLEIGFHTRRHDHLSTLADDALGAAMTDGRDLFEAAVGRALTMIAYPHGKADGRGAEAARAAGYELGLTGLLPRVDPTTDPLLIGRVEAQTLTVRDFAAALAAILAAEDWTPARA